MAASTGRRRLEHSEHPPIRGARHIGPADLADNAQVTISLHRRPDAPPLPDHAYWTRNPPGRRTFLRRAELATQYGAAQSALDTVTTFANSHGLTIVEANAGRRSVIVTGTVAQMSSAFGVTLEKYEAPLPQSKKHKPRGTTTQPPRKQTYRGFSGSVYLPRDVADVVEAVFGLDNRRTGGRNNGDPPNTKPLTVSKVVSLYNFPTTSASGQTIGIVCMEGGYDPTDVTTYFSSSGGGSGYAAPTITRVSVNGGTNEGDDSELTQDICIAANVAQGAAISVYYVPSSGLGDAQAWFHLLNFLLTPGQALPSVITSSYFLSESDDTASLSPSNLNALSARFQELAAAGVTVFVACGDSGSDSGVGDGFAHVSYPGSDPWVTSCGGTTVGDVSGSSFDEVVWNDTSTFPDGSTWVAATGGGISDFFALPPWQCTAGVPPSKNSNASTNPNNGVGRGVPDVAGNASGNSGYPDEIDGTPWRANGTSAVAPLYAGLAAVLNAALGQPIGFLNPTLYALGESVFRDVTSGNNQWGAAANPSTPYYSAGPGWDACTGWGSIDGTALLVALQQLVSGRNMAYAVPLLLDSSATSMAYLTPLLL
jgi:kumamolisin